MKRTTTTAATIGLSLAAALTLSACANPLESLVENVVGEGVENLIENELGDDVDINFGDGADLPSAWPAEIPVPEGEILLSGSSEGTSTVSLNTTAADAEQTLLDLQDAGFEITQESGLGAASKVYILENDTYTVSMAWGGDESEPTVFLQYAVTPKN